MHCVLYFATVCTSNAILSPPLHPFSFQAAIGAVIVDPKSNTTLGMTSSVPGKGENLLQHAVMKCIDLVAHSQGGGAWSICPGNIFAFILFYFYSSSHFVLLFLLCLCPLFLNTYLYLKVLSDILCFQSFLFRM